MLSDQNLPQTHAGDRCAATARPNTAFRIDAFTRDESVKGWPAEIYRHWKVRIDDRVAIVALDVNPSVAWRPSYELKRNSCDLSVLFELYNITERLRFEYPQVAAVILTSAK